MTTLRQKIIDILSMKAADAVELSKALSIPEKEVYEHLTHVARSVSSQNRRFVIIPSICRNCGQIFKERKRLTTPGRCYRCKSERVSMPIYQIISSSSEKRTL